MAKDLAVRLLPAFDTESGIPHPRVHLQFGVPNATICDFCRTETNPAGAGSMMLEFGILSRLLRDSRFEVAAQKVCCLTVICQIFIRNIFFATSQLSPVPSFKAVKSVWKQRSKLGLLGNSIDTERYFCASIHLENL